MNSILKIVIGGALSFMMTSCYVSSMAVVDQDPGEVYVNYYPYYFCPEQNFYFNPDLNIYWWYQGGLWISGSRLPYGYHVSYNTNYVIITAYDRNPTRYYSQHMRDYRRGSYVQTTYHVGDRPMQSLRSYRPAGTDAGSRRSGSASYRSDDIYGSKRSSNYDNKGSRSTLPSQNSGSRSSDTRQSQSSGSQQVNGNDNSNAVRQGSRTDSGSSRFNSGSSSSRVQSERSSGQPASNSRQQASPAASSQQPTNEQRQSQGRSSQASRQEGSRSKGEKQSSSRRSTRESTKKSEDTK